MEDDPVNISAEITEERSCHYFQWDTWLGCYNNAFVEVLLPKEDGCVVWKLVHWTLQPEIYVDYDSRETAILR